MLDWLWQMVKIGGPSIALLIAVTGGLVAYGELRYEVKINSAARLEKQSQLSRVAEEQAAIREALSNIREEQRHMRKQLDSLVDYLLKGSKRGN